MLIKAMPKTKQGREIGSIMGGAEGIFFSSRVVRKNLAEWVMFKQSLEGGGKPWGSTKALRWVHSWCSQGMARRPAGWEELRVVKAAVGLRVAAPLKDRCKSCLGTQGYLRRRKEAEGAVILRCVGA